MLHIKARIYETLLGIRAWVNNTVDSRWDNDPFGNTVLADRNEYMRLFEVARAANYPEIDQIERELGYAVDRAWLDNLALHTQVVKKASALAYPHGRLIYSLLRRYLATLGGGRLCPWWKQVPHVVFRRSAWRKHLKMLVRTAGS